ncbi:MAG: DoxX-like family protein [Ignavibacteria bacterium]
MKRTTLHKILTVLISLVWLINGLFAKVLGLVPRHQQIVARILGESYAFIATKAIGTFEILMFVWVVSRVKSRFCAVTQISIVAVMNTLEYYIAPDLLLFGKLNSIVAVFFIITVYYNEFILNRSIIEHRSN